MSGAAADSHLVIIEKSKGSARDQKTMSDLSGLTIGNYKGVMSAWVVIIGYHRLGDLNIYYSHFYRLGNLRSKLADSILGEGPFPGLRQPPSPRAFT